MEDAQRIAVRNKKQDFLLLSPSGGRLFVRTGVFTFRTIELGYDESRRVWADGNNRLSIVISG